MKFNLPSSKELEYSYAYMFVRGCERQKIKYRHAQKPFWNLKQN